MKEDSVFLVLYKIKNDIGYTGIGGRSSKFKTFLLEGLAKKVAENQSNFLNEEKSDDIQGEGMQIIILTNIFGIWTRLEVLLGLKESGHTHTLSEISYQRDEL